MSLVGEMSSEEQKFFDTRGAEAPPETPAETPSAPETPEAPEAPTQKVEAPADDYKKLSENYENLKRALQEQRFAHKSLKDEAEKSATRSRQLEETFQKFVARVVEQQKPDFEQNPAEHLRHETTEMRKQLSELTEQAKQGKVREEQQGQFMQFQRNVASIEADFVKKNGDYQ